MVGSYQFPRKEPRASHLVVSNEPEPPAMVMSLSDWPQAARAVALSTYAGALGYKTDARQLGLWLPLIGVLALEIGAAFAVVLVRSVTGAQVAQVAHPVPAGVSVAQEPAPPVQTRKRAAKEKPRRPEDDDAGGPPKREAPRGVSALIDHVRANGGVIDLSQRKLARQLGTSRTTLQRAIHELSEAGAVILDTSRAGTRLALA